MADNSVIETTKNTVSVLQETKDMIVKHVKKHSKAIGIVIFLVVIAIAEAVFIYIMWRKWKPKPVAEIASRPVLKPTEELIVSQPVTIIFTCMMDNISDAVKQTTYFTLANFDKTVSLRVYQSARGVAAENGDSGQPADNGYYQHLNIEYKDSTQVYEYNMPNDKVDDKLRTCIIFDPVGLIKVQYGTGPTISPGSKIKMDVAFTTLTAGIALENLLVYDHLFSKLDLDKLML